MRLSKYAQLVKRYGRCNLIHVANGGMWLGLPFALYKTFGLPYMHGETQVGAVLDIGEKAWAKISLVETEAEGETGIYGLDLSESTSMEQKTTRLRMSIGFEDKRASVLQCENGELVFYDSDFLAPLMDVAKSSDYFELVVRSAGGQRYIVAKDGFQVLGAILPLRVIGEEFLHSLAEFESKCVEQFEREKMRTMPHPPDVEGEE